MQKRHLKKSEYILIGAFILIAAFPLATTSTGTSTMDPLANLVQSVDGVQMFAQL